MPRVSAGSIGPGFGCTCPSSLKREQILRAMARASEVTVDYQRTEPDGTLVFRAWTRPEDVYVVTFNPAKPGRICKHALACAVHLVGDWLMAGYEQLRKEMDECHELRKEYRAAERAIARLLKKLTPPSST